MTALIIAIIVAGGSVASIHVRVDQDGALSPKEVQIAVAQLQGIWKRAGITMTSGRYQDPVPAGPLVVSIRIVAARMWQKDGLPVLGWVNERGLDDEVPNLFISLTAVRDTVTAQSYRGRPLLQRPESLRRELVARAVGRVAAHELGHYVFRQRGHERTGLMRVEYSGMDLVADSDAPFLLPASAVVAVRRELVARATSTRPQ